MISKVKKSLALQISAISLAMVLLCSILLGVSSFILYKNDNIESNAKRALSVAQSVAALVDGDEFTQIMDSGEKNDYWYDVKDVFDDVKKRTGVKYLYVLDANYSDTMRYFAEGYDANVDAEAELDLGDEEKLVINGEATYSDELFETIRTGSPTVSELYDSGDFGTMVSGFSAIKNSNGRVVGVVGVDISLQEVMDATTSFAVRIILIIAIFCVFASLFSIWFINRIVGKPIRTLTLASDRMAQGDMNIDFDTHLNNEIGILSASFEKMVEQTKVQADVLGKMADGDLTAQIVSRGEKDLMNHAMARTIDRLNDMFYEVKASSSGVSNGASQIASGAQTLAEGSTEQAATLRQVSDSISDVLQQSEENTRHASDAYEDSRKAGELMSECMGTMAKLTESMKDINESSERIADVIKLVDDIAIQTNLLALNAAVEAARAGQHGKGFAVVAEEVRSLAGRSAAAARETSAMIETNIQKVVEGANIANMTQDNMRSVNEIAAANAKAMERINRASNEQNQAIAEITNGITELSDVVQANSAASQESAAAAHEMSNQAQSLNAIVEHFKLRDELRVESRDQLPAMNSMHY